MLAVCVQDDHGLGRRRAQEKMRPTGRDGVSLAEVGRKPEKSDAGHGGESRQLRGALSRHAVVDEEYVPDVRSDLGDEVDVGRREMRRDQR